MEDVVNNLARELAEAIGTAVAQDSRVEECREKARAAGYEMQVSLEAEIREMLDKLSRTKMDQLDL